MQLMIRSGPLAYIKRRKLITAPGGTAASPPEGEEARHVPTFRVPASRSSMPDTAHIVRSSCSNCVAQRRCIGCCARLEHWPDHLDGSGGLSTRRHRYVVGRRL